MAIAKQIENARIHLRGGNPGAYARGMSSCIRAAMSDRAKSAFIRAIADDKTAHLFTTINNGCVIAAPGI